MRKPYKPSIVDVDGEVATIHLNNGGAATVDAADVGLVVGRAWRSHPNGAGNTYASTTIGGKTTFLHRRILNPPAGRMVDHVDNNGLDCRRANMRVCTGTQNSRNRTSRKTGFKGAHKQHGRDLWYAAVRQKKLGYFKRPEDAARAYDAAALVAFGEFAKLNFPSPTSTGAA